MHDAPPSRRGRARPVADAPVAALVADAGELARDWLLALLAVAPLDAVGRVPAGDLAAHAPELCAAMARALADDEALDALASGELAARAGRLAGASEPADAAAAVEALRGVLWTAALASLQRPEPGLVAALADRLAAVAAAVTAAALAAPREPRVAWPREGAAPGTGGAPGFPTASAPSPADVAGASVAPHAGSHAAAAPGFESAAPHAGSHAAAAPGLESSAPHAGSHAAAAPGFESAAPHAGSHAAAAPGLESAAPHAGSHAAAAPGLESAAPHAGSHAGAAPGLESSAPHAAAPPPFGGSGAGIADAGDAGELRARDLRPRIADGAPLELLERCVGTHLADGRTLAVLLVELDAVDRLLAADVAGEAADAVRRAELAIEELLRPGDAARREAPGRVWVALAGTGPAGARALALRAAAAVEREADHRGTPLTASVGVAVFPVDATDAHALAERAEDALFAARASGSRGAPPPASLR